MGDSYEGHPMLCSHANEVPRNCPCPNWCFCRVAGSCTNKTYGGEKVGTQQKKQDVRKFETGATRDTDEGKHDLEAFLSPRVLEEYGKFMHKNRFQKDGSLRDGDNWTKGIPKPVYMKSLVRHVFDVWLQHRGHKGKEPLKMALCAIIFNAMGYLYELLKEEDKKFESGRDMEDERTDWGV